MLISRKNGLSKKSCCDTWLFIKGNGTFTPRYLPKRMKMYFHIKLCMQIFLTIFCFYNCQKLGTTQCPSVGEWTNKSETSVQWKSTQQFKRANYWYNNVDQSQKNYAKWKKQDSKATQSQGIIPFEWLSEKGKAIGTDSRSVVIKG